MSGVTSFTRSGTENHMRWDGRSKNFFEAWYVTANHLASGCGLWLRYTITVPQSGPGYCELWGALFDVTGKRNFAGKERYPLDRLGTPLGRDDGALLRISDAWIAENHLEGAVARGDRSLEWSLDFAPADACFQHLPALLRSRLEKRMSVVCAPNLDIGVTGSLTIDGYTMEFSGDPAQQGHRWGRRHPETWAWAHCSVWDGEDSAVFEAVAAKTSVGILPAPTSTLVYLKLDDEDLAFTDLKAALTSRSRYEMPTWAFTAKNDTYKIAGAARMTVRHAIQVRYVDPAGAERFCVNSEVADVAIEIYRRETMGWVHHRSLTSTRFGHLEFGRTRPFQELRLDIE
jgi:hypothetical protein